MAVLELKAEEELVVEAALAAHERSLLLEIANADVRSFRERLKEEEAITRFLLQRLRSQLAEPLGRS